MMNKKIIVAEDSNILQKLTKKIFSKFNYSVTSVNDGKQLVDHLAENTFDLVLLDINMPVMDGMECAKNIRLMDSPQKDIPIIAITGNLKNYSEQDFKDVGINTVIPKPLNFDSVVDQVKKLTNDG